MPHVDAGVSSSSTRATGVSATAARERRTVVIGASIVVLSLLVAYVLLPFGRRWQLREIELEGTRARVSELASLSSSRRALDSAATAVERSIAAGGRRVIRARSRALAASALQSFLQDASDASRLVVTRLDVATGDADATDASAAGDAFDRSTADGAEPSAFIPATLSAHCDITGLADLLAQLRHGPRVVHVERMAVQTNSALRGAPDMLQVTLALRAPVIIE